MYLIHKTIEDAGSPRGRISIALSPDQSMNPYTWAPPINWSGYVGGKKVDFIQTSSYGGNLDCYSWEGFPNELSYIRNEIVRLIDDEMRVMD